MPPKPAARTKLIVRNLPPTLSDDAALDALNTIIAPTSYNYVAFIPGKLSNSTIRPARLYVNLCDPADVVRVAAALHNKLFVSERGAQFRASVEFAPSQRIPRQAKPDKRPGTLEGDADFVAFCEQLAEPNPPDMAATDSAQTSRAPVITALMQALIAKHTPAPKQSTKGKRAAGKADEKAAASSKAGKAAAPAKAQAQQGKAAAPAKTQAQQGKAAASAKAQAQQGKAAAKAHQGAEQGKASKKPARSPATGSQGPKVVVAVRQPQKQDQGTGSEEDSGRSVLQAKGNRPHSKAKAAGGQQSDPPQQEQRGAQRVREGFQVYNPRSRGKGQQG